MTSLDSLQLGNTPLPASLALPPSTSFVRVLQMGATPLHWAAWYGRPLVASLLLDRGAAASAVDAVSAHVRVSVARPLQQAIDT